MAATHYETEPDLGVATLLSGIVEDGRKLLTQQLTLFQVEVKNDIRRTIEATIPLLFGVIAILVSAPLLGMASAFFLSWLWPEVPLWMSFGLVGTAAVLCGALLILIGKLQFDTFNPLPEKSLEGLKENIQWKTKT